LIKSKKINQANFGKTVLKQCSTFRPEKQSDIAKIFKSSNTSKGILPLGASLSYGDVCLNSTVISSSRLDRIIEYQSGHNRLTLEPGVCFKELLSLFPSALPPVIPGTVNVTLGGAVANDIHGKNHWHQGSFGNHIESISLAHPSGNILTSPETHPALFFSTIGGLGLTGFINKLTFKLQPKPRFVEVTKKHFENFSEGLAKLIEDANRQDYATLWVDLYRKGKGISLSANHILGVDTIEESLSFIMPFPLPLSPINKLTMSYFNKLYFTLSMRGKKSFKSSLERFNNPLDNVKHFNNLYGKKGLYQLQCVIPFETSNDFAAQLLKQVKKYKASPSLCVVKALNSEGLGFLSFTQPGFTFAIDFPKTETNKALVQHLHQLINELGGRVYLAKDSLLTKSLFKSMYPKHEAFVEVLHNYDIYPHFQSEMSRRLGIH
jgi:decaprenylphospho-beta-D-ribofuranose 2-oxidase